MRRALEALRVDLVDVFGPGGPGREPAVFRDDFQSSLTESGVSAENFRFCSGVAGASMRA